MENIDKAAVLDTDKSVTIDLSGSMAPLNTAVTSESKSLWSIGTAGLSNFSAKEFYTRQKDQLRPWTSFGNSSKFQRPKSLMPAGQRIIRNIEYFQANYLFVFLGLAIFCLITSPMLIIAIGVGLGACYIVSLKNKERKVSIMGKELSLAQQYGIVACCCFPLFWLAGAGSAVFWILGASLFFIVLHAAFYNSDEMAPELEMEAV